MFSVYNNKPWTRTIFAEFENLQLKAQLKGCAKDIDCKIYWGEPNSPDIIAVPYFVSIIDRGVVGKEEWKTYLEYEQQVNDDNTCIVIDHNEVMELPKKKNVFQYNVANKNSITQIISAVKEAKEDLDKKIEKRNHAKEILKTDLKTLREKYPECVPDGIVNYDLFELSPIKILY